MKILVIEDEILIQKSLIKLLEKKGCASQGVVMAREAIDLIQNQDFDRIVCDLMLQDLSGFDIIEESKRKYSQKEIAQKFIIMTAYSSPQILEKAAQYNCKILQKPFDNIANVIDIIIKGV